MYGGKLLKTHSERKNEEIFIPQGDAIVALNTWTYMQKFAGFFN